MEKYWLGLTFGLVSGFGFGRAFQYWLDQKQITHAKLKRLATTDKKQ